MKITALIEEINQLPENLQQEVADFVGSLKKKHNFSVQGQPKIKAGALKGFVMYMAPDFDAPLEDFKDYM